MCANFILKEAVAVIGDEFVDVFLIGGREPEWCLKMLARQNESLRAVVRSADDDEQRSRRSLEHFTKRPRIGQAAAAIVDMRNEGGTKRVIRFPLARLARAAGCAEQAVEQATKFARIA